ncbi:hypothetical protein HMJ29_07180 [Hymenobacter taeanensis]|uniref:DUF3575 domain-containing protein n=1 Tax=Hymenobacter taeanensis TaxID=2735321 RepID=A0A6M6BFK0_9BACT|nr:MULTISPECIES: hypothetical protein [Hymenobacter]QJX46732.1 hypothetical protein HMJ29_07180 [Hymenobacter taeanensis]UOQ80600.1 hypothetical protein MUN83_17525 [Hymenobacter sp. 5414T-23]
MGQMRRLLLGLLAYGWALQPVVAQQDAQPSAGPFFVALHFAGGTGLVAVGGGYRLAHQRLEPEVLVGYLPAKVAGRAAAVLTLKASYIPFSPRLGHSSWEVSPVAAGGWLSYTTGQQYFLTNNSAGRYRPGYYWWSSAVRVGAFVGPRLTRVGHPGTRHTPRQTLYAELGTNDLYLVSALTNHTLRLTDILTLGAGVKGSW